MRSLAAPGAGLEDPLVHKVSIGHNSGPRHSGRWRRVLAVDHAGDTDWVITAFGAGASGVPLGPPPASRPVYSDPALAPMQGLHLTDREIEILPLVAGGPDQQVDRERLSLSPMTVKSHVRRIGQKMGTGDRAQMVAMAMRWGNDLLRRRHRRPTSGWRGVVKQ